MIIVLSVITLFSGLALGGLNELTYETAQNNILKFKKIPAVATIYEVISGELTTEKRILLEEELLSEKIFVDVGEEEPVLMFVIKKDNKPYAITFERFGQGFGGSLGVMVGYEMETKKLVAIGITTMSETPGIGTRVTDPGFAKQFQSMPANAIFKVKKDGGHIDAIGGATVSSRAVAFAVAEAKTFFNQHRDTIATALNR